MASQSTDDSILGSPMMEVPILGFPITDDGILRFPRSACPPFRTAQHGHDDLKTPTLTDKLLPSMTQTPTSTSQTPTPTPINHRSPDWAAQAARRRVAPLRVAPDYRCWDPLGLQRLGWRYMAITVSTHREWTDRANSHTVFPAAYLSQSKS